MPPPPTSPGPLAAAAARDRLVTVATFAEAIEAHLARARLESEGIECLLADEHIVGVHWLYSVAVGGVKLQVRAADRGQALLALEEAVRPPSASMDWISADLDAPRCPTCGSLRVDTARLSRRLVLLSWLLLGVPLPFLRRWASCGSCGARWRARPKPEAD